MPSPFFFLLVIIVLVRYPPSITGNFEKQDAQIFYTGLINALLLKCYPTHYAWLNLSNQVGPNMRKKASLASQKQGEPFTHVKKPKTLFHHLYPSSFSFSKRVYPCLLTTQYQALGYLSKSSTTFGNIHLLFEWPSNL